MLIFVNTELDVQDLLNNHMACAVVSRGGYDAQLFTQRTRATGRGARP